MVNRNETESNSSPESADTYSTDSATDEEMAELLSKTLECGTDTEDDWEDSEMVE